MYSKIVALSALLVTVIGGPTPTQQPGAEPVAIVAQESDIQPDGSFKWNFESADGTKQEQSGSVKAGATEQESVASVEGSVSWTDPEGNPHEIKYVADENGFQPQGADVPQVPAQIARALEWIAAHPQPEETATQ